MCFHGLHFSGSRLLCWKLSEVGPGLHALPTPELLRFTFLSTPQRHGLSWACVLCASHVSAAQVSRCLASAVTPRWGVRLITSPVPATGFSGCTMGTPSQVCLVSLLASCSLAVTLLSDVSHPESQEVLISNEACLPFGRGCLSGATIAPFGLWLLPPACLRQRMGQSAAC